MLRGLLDALRRRLEPRGLDLLQAFDAAAYNQAIGEPLLPLPVGASGSALAILVGNTRALWEPFRIAWAATPALQAHDHPLDTYVTEVLEGCRPLLEKALPEGAPPPEIRWAHGTGPELVSMSRLAAVSGLAELGPAHLAVHPTHGPWIGLRAVLVLPLPPPAPGARPTPCAGCPAPCVPALEVAREAGRNTWRPWLAIREVCPIGRSSRYSREQTEYHYTKDRRLLEPSREPETTSPPGVLDPPR